MKVFLDRELQGDGYIILFDPGKYVGVPITDDH